MRTENIAPHANVTNQRKEDTRNQIHAEDGNAAIALNVEA
jgi:hypothetical protein